MGERVLAGFFIPQNPIALQTTLQSLDGITAARLPQEADLRLHIGSLDTAHPIPQVSTSPGLRLQVTKAQEEALLTLLIHLEAARLPLHGLPDLIVVVEADLRDIV